MAAEAYPQIFPNKQRRLNERIQRRFGSSKLAGMFGKGRPIGKLPGSYVDEKVSLRKTVILCSSHKNLFDHKRADYFDDPGLPDIIGTCSHCRSRETDCRLFMHNSYINCSGVPGVGGYKKNGFHQPRQDQKNDAIEARKLKDGHYARKQAGFASRR